MNRNPLPDVFTPWAKAQHEFWERWRATLAGDSPSNLPAFGLWNLPIELWRVAIYEGLDVQLAMAEAWTAWACANDAHIPELTLGASQTLHFVEDWTRAQMRLWDSWFAALEGATSLPGAPPAPVRQRSVRLRRHEHQPAQPAQPPPTSGVAA